MQLSKHQNFPLKPEVWEKISDRWSLPPQERRIAEGILLNYSDRQICQSISIKQPTLRTYIKRLYLRTQTTDRLDLVLAIFRHYCSEGNCA